MNASNRMGIVMMVATMAAFSVQDGLSRYLAETYNTLMVVAFRYWIFAAYVMVIAVRRPEGFRAAIQSTRLPVHILRGTLLVLEMGILIYAYTQIGLIESHAIFAACPLIVVAMSGPILGERLSLRQLVALAAGFCGVLIILRPGSGLFSWTILLPLAATAMFALYSVLTRLTARSEPGFPSFFWPAIVGAVLMTGVGVPNWQPVAPSDWPLLLTYAGIAVLSNWCLLKTYQLAEASAVQPFAYLQIVFVSAIGVTVFHETLSPAVVIGALVVIASGLSTFFFAQGKRSHG